MENRWTHNELCQRLNSIENMLLNNDGIIKRIEMNEKKIQDIEKKIDEFDNFSTIAEASDTNEN